MYLLAKITKCTGVRKKNTRSYRRLYEVYQGRLIINGRIEKAFLQICQNSENIEIITQHLKKH